MEEMRGEEGKSSENDRHVLHYQLTHGDHDDRRRVGLSPYVRAKHLQLDPDAAIVFFWKAVNAGDRVDSALKDMAVVLKQQDRTEEAIEVIRSCRDRCSVQAQESLDNVLIDLYKFSMGTHKDSTLTRKEIPSHRRARNVQDTGLPGMGVHAAAELVYRKAQLMNPDSNKACNLACCLMKQTR